MDQIFFLSQVSVSTYGPKPLSSDWRDVGVREVVVQPSSLKMSGAVLPSLPKVHIKHSLSVPLRAIHTAIECASVNTAQTNNETVKSVLRFVPTQVKQGHKRIVFHQKSG